MLQQLGPKKNCNLCIMNDTFEKLYSVIPLGCRKLPLYHSVIRRKRIRLLRQGSWIDSIRCQWKHVLWLGSGWKMNIRKAVQNCFNKLSIDNNFSTKHMVTENENIERMVQKAKRLHRRMVLIDKGFIPIHTVSLIGRKKRRAHKLWDKSHWRANQIYSTTKHIMQIHQVHFCAILNCAMRQGLSRARWLILIIKKYWLIIWLNGTS